MLFVLWYGHRCGGVVFIEVLCNLGYFLVVFVVVSHPGNIYIYN